MDAGHGDGQDREAEARRHTYCGREPDVGLGFQPSHKVFPGEDHAAADEPNSRNNLGGDARRVDDDAILEYVGKTVFGDEHD